MRESRLRAVNSVRPMPIPRYYPFELGAHAAVVASDGVLDLGDFRRSFEAPPELIEAALVDHFIQPDNGLLEQNALVLRIAGKTVLFDTGMGNLTMFGPGTGRLLRSLTEAGIDPHEVDAVVCTHAHVDHIGALCDSEGRPNFPHAEVFISKRDFDDWTDSRLLDSPLADEVRHARHNLLPLRDRMNFIGDRDEILPGIVAVATPGHTYGHLCFLIESGGHRVCFIGDLMHNHAIQLTHPTLNFIHDADSSQAAHSRANLLARLARERIAVASYHFPWPGLGHVVRCEKGFRLVPTPMRWRD